MVCQIVWIIWKVPKINLNLYSSAKQNLFSNQFFDLLSLSYLGGYYVEIFFSSLWYTLWHTGILLTSNNLFQSIVS